MGIFNIMAVDIYGMFDFRETINQSHTTQYFFDRFTVQYLLLLCA
jgi:hypothetical protein